MIDQDKKEIEPYVKLFQNIVNNEKQTSSGMAAIRTLLEFLEKTDSTTVQELRHHFQNLIKEMILSDKAIASIASGSELFSRFITFASLDTTPFTECRKIMLHRGKSFYKKLLLARGKVAEAAARFITDDVTILTHSKSRVVLEAMKKAVAQNKVFKVYVTKSFPDGIGEEMCENLTELGIPCTLILDAAVAYIMEKVDMVMVGAEGVSESGGIINKIGTYNMAICAREMKKPFFVLAESFKFSRVYPLNQADLPNEYKYTSSMMKPDMEKEDPLVDYTPPQYINLLFTDLGVLTPSAVSDELIKLYL